MCFLTSFHIHPINGNMFFCKINIKCFDCLQFDLKTNIYTVTSSYIFLAFYGRVCINLILIVRCFFGKWVLMCPTFLYRTCCFYRN